MNFGTVRTIFLKELLDTFRDKRTLIAMIGVPVVLYPALLILVTQVTLVQQSRLAAQDSRVAVVGPGTETIEEWFFGADHIELVATADPEAALAAGDVDAVIVTETDMTAAMAAAGTATAEVQYDATEARSREALDRIRETFSHERERYLNRRVRRAGLSETFANPLEVEYDNVAPPAKSTGSILGTILPLIMVVMLGVGAFYPAVDLTAGEKERGTFETLLSTPAAKLDIVAGKFLAVFGLSMLTGILNLASMIATVLLQLSQISAAEGDEALMPAIEIPPLTIAKIFLVLIPLAFFIAAVMMTVALLARSFREAQNYVSPFFLAIVLPASAAAIPGIELTPVTQFVPIANVALLFRDLLTGDVGADMVFFVFISTAVYALLALLVAAWMFQREDVVLSEESAAPLTFDRGSLAASPAPTPGISLAIFAVVMLLLFYAGSVVQAWRLHWGVLITQYGLILAPVLLALWYGKVEFRSALNLRRLSAINVLGTVFVALGWVVLSIQVSILQNRSLPIPEEMQELARRLFDTAGLPGGAIALLAVIALSPAICEEVLFRGALLSGLRRRLPDWAAIIAVGVLFGLFHLSLYKLLPTAVTGIVFTYLVVRTGSIFASMLAHFTLNGLSVLVETGSLPGPILIRLNDPAIESTGLPWSWIAFGAVVFLAGIAVLETVGRRRESKDLVSEH